MDKDFEKKVKQKRIRTIAVALVILTAVVYLISGTKVEKADYTASLEKEIQIAQALYDENKDNIGNQKGQYTEAVMAQLAQDIAAAKAVLEDEKSEYHDRKLACETLREKITAFKKAANSKDLASPHKKKEEKKTDADDVSKPASQKKAETDGDSGTKKTGSKGDQDKEPSSNQQQEKPADHKITVSLTIRCDTLAADLSKLRDKALEAYVPADGIILSLPKISVTKGETVYDVLDRVCRDKGIHMEAVYTPTYGADYVEGINYLYEFDAGEQSGWMYKVNDVFPNYGCSDYVLEDGDSIVWAYTCDMGRDLGKQI